MVTRIKRKFISFRNEITQSSFFKNTALIITGNVIAQLLAVVFMPIKSRLYGPELFGEFGIFTATINIVNGLVCLGLVSAIVSPEEDKEGSAIYKVCLISSITFAIVLLVLALILSPVFRVIHVSANYYLICILMGVFLVVNNWAAMTYTWGNRQKAYKLLMYNPIIGQVVNFIVVVCFVLLDVKSVGLIAGAIVSQIVIMIHLLRHLKPMQFKHSIEDFKFVLRKYKDFPMYQMPSNFLKGFGAQFPIILMGTYFGANFVGHYNMGQSLLYVPITLVGSAMGQVHFKQATDIYNSGGDVGEFTYKVVKGILIFAFFPLLICAIFGEWIFRFFLGADWGIAGNIAQIRSFELLFVSMMVSVSYILVVLRKQHMVLVYTIATLIFANFTVFAGGYYLNHDIITVLVLSIGNAILNFAFLFYAFSQTEFGTRKYIQLVFLASTVFIVFALAGNWFLRGIM
jgi:O-antigen/teichoic acid export membrane protein